MKCEVPGCTREHMWMKEGKLVCSIHYTPSNQINWVDEIQQAKLPEAPLLDVRDFDEDEDYRKLWEKPPDLQPKDLHPDDYPSWAAPKSKINIHKGNEDILEDWEDESLKPFRWPDNQIMKPWKPEFRSKELANRLRGYKVWEPKVVKSEHWDKQLMGMQGGNPEDKLLIDEETLREIFERLDKFMENRKKEQDETETL
jgi:hypothetical protein